MRDYKAFITAHTVARPVPSVPQISLYQADDSTALWQMTEADLDQNQLPPPFWAFAWSGGQALSRYVLDNPEMVAGKRVLDLACGSGLVGIAAHIAGAAQVICNDIDPYCEAAVALNAEFNGYSIEFKAGDLLSLGLPDVDVILAGDIAYEKPMLEAMLTVLRTAAVEGKAVYVGDPHRTYFPKTGFIRCADYDIETSTDIEDKPVKPATVWRLRP
ncbi:class I SAM-dependent methyltransferase [Asticcacaulis machinosus]|uniref:50S ribosomal protein L11 methyltransferase n=1 Tax=Asticcacaulis machinosus TaxID=2984211 RepID=A0ABT5HQ31_9CAUL|nr:50S ribosomal protein L11 methyltransferase [Asticcacaulis machinosus]MDC7677754.1 50S ribosomal protein L11 methyltransferase [Asticcacaulis machinosus]